ncbi:MAG: ferrochelatase [Coriobacteriia bacterium]|nr:ferrochelatase [Coriobacteriia bacterium]
MPRTGVLITGFGGPDSLDAVAPFMCNLMGREPAPELVERVCARYEAIGGSSPLVRIAGELAEGVSAALAEAGESMPVEVGMRYWEPYVEDAIARLAASGVERIVTMALSAYETKVTHGEYRAAVDEALAARPGVTAVEAPLLSALPVFTELHAQAAADALAVLNVPDAPVVFSAHSLPEADVADDDAYVRGLEECAERVAAVLGLHAGASDTVMFPGVIAYGSAAGPRPWLVAYQSKGARGGEWLGPDIDDVIDAIGAAGRGGVLVVPLGFATDHMETLYDLDIVARDRADAAAVAFARSAVPNADPRFVAAIAAAVRGVLGTKR